jgi:hypothetical protein
MEDRLGGALARALADDPRIWAEPDRLRAVLMGLSPGHQADRQALVAAAEEGIVQALLDAPSAAEIRLLSTRLQARTGMDRTFADWAIRLWSSVLGLTLGPEAWESPAPEPTAAAPVRSIPAEKRGTSWLRVGALCVLFLLLAGLLVQKVIFPWQKPDTKPTPSPRAAVPENWLSREGNLERLKTTFVGTRSLTGRPPEVFSLQIRSLQSEGGQIKFEYALNSSGIRRDNLGTVLPLQGRLDIPDLGSGNCFLERDHLVIAIQGASPKDLWELRETP